MADCRNLELARQWAADVDADRETLSQDTIDAAADLISSLPDEWVDAKELREVIDKWEGREITSDAHLLYREVEALLPTPLAPEPASPRPENLPDGTVLIDKDGDPWQLDGDWFVPDCPGGGPVPEASPRRPPGLLRPINRHEPRLLPPRQQHLHTPLPPPSTEGEPHDRPQ